MAMEQEQDDQGPQRDYKHYCRICKKGFVCGRSLGGHMRAHGLMDGAAGFSAVETSGEGEWDYEKANGGAGAKRMYALRSKPNRLKSCRVCENCGMEFVSWKSFLEHGKCVSGDDGEAIGYDEHERESSLSGDDELVGWSKGKRSRRTKVAMSEEEDLANCLVLLSSSRVDTVSGLIESEESCDSAIKEDRQRKDTINATATGAVEAAAAAPKALLPAFTLQTPPAVPRGLFECKACKKVFASHQALGGHRASHKKVKGCFASKLNALDETPPPPLPVPADEDPVIATHNRYNAGSSDQMTLMSMAITSIDNPAPLAVVPVAKKKPKVHECSICHRVFTSGQALGGHKRCHWITSSSPPNPTLKLQPLSDRPGLHQPLTLRPTLVSNSNSDNFDLNMLPNNGGARSHIGSSLRLDTPAAIYLRSWTNDHEHASKNRAGATTSSDMNNDDDDDQKHTITDLLKATMGEDEVDSKVKLAKLSELKDINMGEEESSEWLQVGIGSSAKEGSEA
ncbi:hypothetical protein ZIOFF_054706 [Zingiber officinale]|uniref:C2H2-type domain-containing protein n=1 Tax=Zingiber officinale TaxID=94328 RepID=A0A8J5FEE7_ZINOF|nr:hypothetical protein ZIOFF_054706 [Zingiber officinale]